jgi:hypothetical protein
METTPPNQIGPATHLYASALNAERQFVSASCAPPFLSAAVTPPLRSLTSTVLVPPGYVGRERHN